MMITSQSSTEGFTQLTRSGIITKIFAMSANHLQQGWQNSSIRGQIINILDLIAIWYLVHLLTLHHRTKAAIDNTYRGECWCAPGQLYGH